MHDNVHNLKLLQIFDETSITSKQTNKQAPEQANKQNPPDTILDISINPLHLAFA